MAAFFINRPIFAWVIAIIIMLAGLLALGRLPVAHYPDIALPQISISAQYPGATASIVDRSVTQIIEQQIKGLDNLLHMKSTSSSSGGTEITLTFAAGTDADTAQVQVQNKVQQALSLLPDIVQRQGVQASKAVDNSFMTVAFYDASDTMRPNDISDYVASSLVDPLSRVQGVGAITLYGFQNAMRIWCDPDKMRQYKLNPQDIIAAVRAQNAQVAGGQVGAAPALPGQEINIAINASSSLETAEQFEQIQLRVEENGSAVLLNLLLKGLKNKMFTLDQADLAMDEGLKGGKQGSFEFKDMAKYLPQFAALGTGMKSHAGYQMHIANAEAIETVSADPDQAGNNYINLLQKLNAPDVKNNFKKKGINLTKVQLQAASKGIDPVTAMADAVESLMHKSKGYQKLKKKLAAAQNDDERRQIYLARTSMHRIDSSTATPDGRFTEGNPTIPVPATTVTADWLNAMQEEAIAVLAAAGIAPDKANNAQMLAAILKLIADSTPSIATSQENGIGRPDGITITIDASGKYTATTRPFILGEFYYFRHPSLRTGFAPCQGGILANAVTQHPEIWAYLQTAEGQLLLKTEAEWQAMSTATWATLADGTKVGWNGIGGVPYYVQDLATGTLRLPDLRGMYAEAAGFDSLGVGGVHGDMIRNIVGTNFQHMPNGDPTRTPMPTGVMRWKSPADYIGNFGGQSNYAYTYVFDTSYVVPVGKANKPRGWGALACCYLGQPA